MSTIIDKIICTENMIIETLKLPPGIHTNTVDRQSAKSYIYKCTFIVKYGTEDSHQYLQLVTIIGAIC